jgi:hypothetical protein
MVEYNNRNPDDEITYKEVHSTLTKAIAKLRHRAQNPDFNQEEGVLLNRLWGEIQ